MCFHLLVFSGEQGVLLEDDQQPSSEPDTHVLDMSAGAWDEGNAACPPKAGERDLLGVGDLESGRDEGGGAEGVASKVPPRTISVTSGELVAAD